MSGEGFVEACERNEGAVARELLSRSAGLLNTTVQADGWTGGRQHRAQLT